MTRNYRVDTIPGYLKPFFWLYGYGLGVICYGLLMLFHLVCRIEFRGAEYLNAHPNHILAMWHDNNAPFFCASIRYRYRYVWMNHPAWYMKPVHVFLRLLGVRRLVLGSTDHKGRAASDIITGYLKEGWSTFINPDGPAGPPRALKKGALYMSRESGVPIIPVTVETPHCVTLKSTWDAKRIPLPFTRIIVHYHEPILVTHANFDEALVCLKASMG